LFDTTRTRQAAAHGAVLTWNGPRFALEGENSDSHWMGALADVHSAISTNSLRELAQSQSLNSPRLVEHMRNHDKLISSSEGILSQVVSSGSALRVHSIESHDDPVILDWVDFISNRYEAPSGLDDVLILLPCSARKPYSSSRSHKAFRRAINHTSAHEVMVTSPLGLVPRDLEEVWPAGHYDIPVTGDWTQDEINRVTRMLDSLVSKNKYRVIINHSGLEYSSSIEVIETRQGSSATSHEALDRLSEAIASQMQSKKRSGERINIDNFRSVARFHHLNDKWLDGIKVRGRFPRWKILKDDEQIAMWAPERGSFSLAKACVGILESCDSLKRIRLKENLKWKGDVNLVNLESFDNTIRKGEDVLVMQGSQCLGLARASAPAWEWQGTPGRLAKMHQRL
jgi:archaeosine synthase